MAYAASSNYDKRHALIGPVSRHVKADEPEGLRASDEFRRCSSSLRSPRQAQLGVSSCTGTRSPRRSVQPGPPAGLPSLAPERRPLRRQLGRL